MASLGHTSAKRVSHLGFVTAPTSVNGGQPNFARCFAVSRAGTLYVHFRGLLSPNGIMPGEKNHFASKSGVLLYWQRYCTALEHSGGLTYRHSRHVPRDRNSQGARTRGVLSGLDVRDHSRSLYTVPGTV